LDDDARRFADRPRGHEEVVETEPREPEEPDAGEELDPGSQQAEPEVEPPPEAPPTAPADPPSAG
jgi:hypothetical protein